MIGNILASGIGAYQKNQELGAGMPNIGATQAAGKPSFADMISDSVGAAMDTIKQGEAASVAAAKGNADLTSVVLALSNAEMTLQTVVSIRDRVISAYQDILRMPI